MVISSSEPRLKTRPAHFGSLSSCGRACTMSVTWQKHLD